MGSKFFLPGHFFLKFFLWVKFFRYLVALRCILTNLMLITVCRFYTDWFQSEGHQEYCNEVESIRWAQCKVGYELKIFQFHYNDLIHPAWNWVATNITADGNVTDIPKELFIFVLIHLKSLNYLCSNVQCYYVKIKGFK